MKRNDFFFCYNIRLANYLIKGGFEFITQAYSKEKKLFYLFENTDRLTNAIQEYKNSKTLV